MISRMTKKEASILFGLVGIILGMVCSVFLEYPISYTDVDKILHTSCANDSVDKIKLSFFGKIVTVRCKNGETSTFKLIE